MYTMFRTNIKRSKTARKLSVTVPRERFTKNSVPTARIFSRKTYRLSSPTEISESILGRPGIL